MSCDNTTNKTYFRSFNWHIHNTEVVGIKSQSSTTVVLVQEVVDYLEVQDDVLLVLLPASTSSGPYVCAPQKETSYLYNRLLYVQVPSNVKYVVCSM